MPVPTITGPRLPIYLQGLEPPVTVEDAIEYAREHGASPEVLEFLETLPAAVFTSSSGIEHALGMLEEEDLPGDPEEASIAEDGVAG
jgi:uroporphyrinogen-III synthase